VQLAVSTTAIHRLVSARFFFFFFFLLVCQTFGTNSILKTQWYDELCDVFLEAIKFVYLFTVCRLFVTKVVFRNRRPLVKLPANADAKSGFFVVVVVVVRCFLFARNDVI
jgi:hypothetical protein